MTKNILIRGAKQYCVCTISTLLLIVLLGGMSFSREELTSEISTNESVNKHEQNCEPAFTSSVFSEKNILSIGDVGEFVPGRFLKLPVRTDGIINEAIVLTTLFGQIELWTVRKGSDNRICWRPTELGIPLSLGFKDFVDVRLKYEQGKIELEYHLWGAEIESTQGTDDPQRCSYPDCSGGPQNSFPLYSFLSSMTNYQEMNVVDEEPVVTVFTSSQQTDYCFDHSDIDDVEQYIKSRYPCLSVVRSAPESECDQTDHLWSRAIDCVAAIKHIPFPIVWDTEFTELTYCGRYPFILITRESHRRTIHSMEFRDGIPRSSDDEIASSVKVMFLSHKMNGIDFDVLRLHFQREGKNWKIVDIISEEE